MDGIIQNKKIESKEQLERIVAVEDTIFILGSGWIGKLLFWYIKSVCGDKEMQVVCCDEATAVVKWEQPTVLLETVRQTCEQAIFIAAMQEADGSRMAEVFNGGNVYYISNELKNFMDDELMLHNADLYEREVLLNRKRELDFLLKPQIDAEIQQLLSVTPFPCFQSIEIETLNRCNGTCSFCPVNCKDDTREYAKMDEDLFRGIIQQLKQMEYVGRVSLFSNNEPLLDNRIYEFAKYTYEQLPNACKIIYTNGTLLTVDKLLLLARYLDVICIDIYYDDIETAITSNMRSVLECCLESNELQEKVMVALINRKAIRNNRGGQSDNRHIFYYVKTSCLLPFIQMIVRPDGKVSLCCNDPLGKMTLGDVSKESLLDVWRGKAYETIREQIRAGRSNLKLCEACDNYATSNRKGNDIFSKEQRREAWEKVNDILR